MHSIETDNARLYRVVAERAWQDENADRAE